ncbi:MAG: arsenite methyltransferase [Planctomycetota bacterium]|nr:arsenite methyltransferase [Planctomycetota bacterium]
MTQEQAIRDQVAQDYAKAVLRPGAAPSSSSCCGVDACCQPEQKGVAVKSAGYSADELASLPEDAVVNSFGCGNPTAFTNVKKGDVVLDLGSGAGIDILLAAKKVGPTGRAIGIDMTDKMIAKANENIANSGLDNVEVRKGIIENMPIEDASVDWVISNCVINLSPEKTKVFKEIARVLKPGGQVLVSDLVVEDLPESVRNDPRLYSCCVSGAINETQYLQGLRDAGLEDVEVVDRFVYNSEQLKAFLASEILEENTSSCCGSDSASGGLSAEQASAMASDLEGKIWSANFSARKP